MTYSYVKNRIADAVLELCTGPGDVRSRLLSANNETISLIDNHFPSELLPLWLEIHHMLTKHGPAIDFEGKISEGAIPNTLRKIKNSTGVKITEKLYKLHRELQRKY